MKHLTIQEIARDQGCFDTVYGWTEDQNARAAGLWKVPLPAPDLEGLRRVKTAWDAHGPNYFRKLESEGRVYNYQWAQAAFTEGIRESWRMDCQHRPHMRDDPPRRLLYFARMRGAFIV